MSDRIEQILIPDIGGAADVSVIEVLVKPGDKIKKEQSLVTLEGEKATMDVPSPFDGIIKDIKVKVGDLVKEGSLIALLSVAGAPTSDAKTVEPKAIAAKEPETTLTTSKTELPEAPAITPVIEAKIESDADVDSGFGTSVHAGPAVRRTAREFGIDLKKVTATGPKGRLLKEDVQAFVKEQLRIAQSKSSGFSMPAMPTVDFSKFGAIDTKPLSKIQKLSGANLSRNWVSIPHVTQFGEADITELEHFRQNQKKLADSHGVRLTPLVFLMKALVAALKKFPHFNASLDATGEQLILKKYFHIGVAVDTPNGLVVPVIRDVDTKGLFELAKILGDISEKARTKGLSLTDMQGGCFSISSLGGIGGTAFTPIINAPEVAILGVSKSQWKTVFNTKTDAQTRLMLPLSLSYDHRVIDGADGARFMVYLTECLADIRTLLL